MSENDAVAKARKEAEAQLGTLDKALARRVERQIEAAACDCDGEGTVPAEQCVTHPAPQPSGPVQVKPLEWEERVGVDGTFDAYTSIGHYIATITDDDRGMWFVVGLTQSNYCAPDIDIVKAAAQADYERRIFSALTAGKPEQSGWKLVPEEPTPEMVSACLPMYDAFIPDSEWQFTINLYRKLLSVAPAAPTAGGGDA